MPFYEYECSACKYYTEVMQKISDAPLTKCPSCGQEALQRLISAPVFRLKGGGWYETDFKSDKETKRNLAEDKEPASSDDSKAAVRASKALKKVVAKKTGKGKATSKVAAKKAAKKAIKKVGKKPKAKPVKQATKKVAAKKGVKKSLKKATGKPLKKTAKKK